MSDADDEPPPPADHQAWCRIVQTDQLHRFREGLIVAAIQDGFGKAGVDQRIIGKMAEYISDRMEEVIRGAVAKKPFDDEGRAVVEATHGEMVKAMLSPRSADGQALRSSFAGTLRFRATDKVRAAYKAMKRGGEAPDDIGTVVDPDTMDDVFSIEEQKVHVQLILSRVKDKGKRAAFELHMEGVPYGSDRGHSIASILGISRDTARDWVADVQVQLSKLVRKP
ncbi:hypothetical protein [Tsuneonella sp. HG222]